MANSLFGLNDPNNPFLTAANATGQSSQQNVNQQTQANRANQRNPFGTLNWSQDPTTGQWTQTTALNQPQQQALDAQQQTQLGRSNLANTVMGRVQQDYAQGLDFSSMPQLSTYNPQSASQYNSQAGDALMGQWNQRVGQNFQTDQQILVQQLRNRGIKPGDPAYDREYKNLTDQQGYLRNDASFSAAQLSGQEAQRLQGMDLAGANYQNNLSGLARQQAAAEQGYNLSQLDALLEGQGIEAPTFPGYAAAGQAQPTDYLGATEAQFNAKVSDENASNAKTAGIVSGITGLAGLDLGGGATLGGAALGKLGGALGIGGAGAAGAFGAGGSALGTGAALAETAGLVSGAGAGAAGAGAAGAGAAGAGAAGAAGVGSQLLAAAPWAAATFGAAELLNSFVGENDHKFDPNKVEAVSADGRTGTVGNMSMTVSKKSGNQASTMQWKNPDGRVIDLALTRPRVGQMSAKQAYEELQKKGAVLPSLPSFTADYERLQKGK